ncbi:hypothetical protein M8C21_026746, partial [Ambrosia artemisiifolia]
VKNLILGQEFNYQQTSPVFQKLHIIKSICKPQQVAMDPFSEPISRLSDAVIHVIRTTSDFKPQLTQLKNTLDRIEPIIVDIQNHNRKLPRTSAEQDMFVDEIQDAIKLVQKCLKIKWNFFKRFTYSLKLKDLDQRLVRFFQIEVQAVQCRDIKEILEEVKYARNRETHKANTDGTPMSSRTSERNKLGWRVPPPPRGIVGFDKPLKKLKDKLLSDINIHDDGKVVVVSALGGSGKTTLVKMLCNDSQIQDNFGDKIFFVTVSETPDFMVSVNDLFNPFCSNQQVKFQGIEDAKNRNFEFDIKGYTLLVTSRIVFTKYDVFKFDPLSDEDAKILFHRSARPIPTIDKNLVDRIVKCCKKHPLSLSVVGSSLNGKDEIVWRSMLISFSQGHSVVDLNQEVLNRLERSFEALEDKFKQCFMDFGLFLEDQRIPASVLLDMWVHLYNHVMKVLIPLQRFTNCPTEILLMHDLLRQLAINLNSKLPIAKRRRLIISEQKDLLVTNVQGKDQMASIDQIQEPMLARILSISSGESFSSRWCNMRVPEVEVLLLNLKSGTYSLPPFLKEVQKLKKISFRSCNLGKVYETDNLNVWPRLVEAEVRACQQLKKLPESISKLQNLSILDISRCSYVAKLPEKIGSLGGLRTIYMTGFLSKFFKLPQSVKDLSNTKVICNQELASQWKEYSNVEITVTED